jgi:hypothetical protein
MHVRALALIAAAALFPRGAHAEPPALADDDATRNAARELAREATALMEQKRWQEASDRLDRAYVLVRAPTIAVLHGAALERQGKLVEAIERYEAARRTPLPASSGPFREAIEYAHERLADLRPRIPRLRIDVDGAEVDDSRIEVRLDGKRVLPPLLEVERSVNPGPHRIELFVNEELEDERNVDIAEAARETTTLDVDEDVLSGRADNSLRQSAGFAALGIGGAGIVTGVVAGLVMLDKKATLDERCTPSCPPELEEDLDSFRTSRTLSIVGYSVGAVGLGVGAVLLWAGPSGDSVSAFAGPTSIGVRGKF